jgi:hypothetical protein
MAVPFSPADIAKYKPLFQRPARPNLFSTPAGLKALEEERSGLASFLGETDYSAQNQEATDLAKLQIALSLMGRGFAAMGATPKRGESALGTLGRTMIAPIAGDISTIAGPLMKQRAAAKLAERQEERQLKLSALTRVQGRRDQAYADDVAATEKAREFVMKTLKKGDTVSEDYTVDGVNVPVIKRIAYNGEFEGFFDLKGKKIAAPRLKVWHEAKALKPITSWAQDVYVKGPDGEFVPAPGALRIADATGQNSRVVNNNVTLNFDPKSPGYNAKIIKPDSKASIYSAPSRTPVFLSQAAINVFDMPQKNLNQKATYKIYEVYPDKAGPNTPPIKALEVGGNTYYINQHSGYDQATGKIKMNQGGGRKPVIVDASDLFRQEDPKDYRPVGKPFVVSMEGLAETNNIPGMGRAKVGDEVVVEINSQGQERLRFGPITIDFKSLSKSQKALFQTQPLSSVEKIKLGQTPESWSGRGTMTVGLDNLDQIQKIPGMGGAKVRDEVILEENQLGKFRVRFGSVTVDLDSSQAALFQKQSISPVDQLKAGQTFRKFAKTGELVVPPGKTDLIAGSKVNEKVIIEKDQEGKVQYTYKGKRIAEDIALQLQASPLSEVDKVAAGLVLEPRVAFVNTSKRTLNVGGQMIGPNQTGYLSKTDINSDAFRNVSGSFREVGPVSTDAVTYMFKEPKTIAVGDQIVEYTPGDEVRYTPQEFANLPKDLQKILTDDTAVRAATLKKNYFTSIWKDVIKREGLPSRDIEESDLQTLLGIFPAGMRSGQRLLRDEIFKMISLGATANPDTSVLPAAAAAYAAEETYAQSVREQLSAAETRYNEYLIRGVIPRTPWATLSFEKKRAFADMPRVMQITNANLLWQKAQDRLAEDKASFKPMSHDDVAAFGSAAELLILARHLRDGQELDKTGRFFVGTLSKLGAGIFADVEPLTSGASRRLQQIINRMKASYATLSATEGGGRDTVFRQQLQAALVPEFNKAESMNRANLDSMINRLETNMRSVFNKEIQSTSTVPKIFEIMAKEAGITGVSVDQKRYRWLDPNEKEKPPVTRQRVMAALNMVPYSIDDALDLRAGRVLPPASDLPDKRFVKIKNLDNGEVLIQRARNDGKPDPKFRPIVMFVDPESKQIMTRKQK